MRKFKFIFVWATLLVMVACEKKVEVEKPSIEDEGVFVQNDYNLDMRDFAMAVNEAISDNKTFLTLVRDEVNKQFDGDYNVLLSQIVDAKVTKYAIGTDGRTFASGEITVRDLLNLSLDRAMEKVCSRGNKAVMDRFKTAGTTLVDRLMAKYPELQIAVPFHPKHLDNEAYIPPVVFLPEEYDEKKTETLPAFRGDLSFPIKAKVTPDSACVVISKNERGGIYYGGKIPNVPSVDKVTGVVNGMSIKLHWNMPHIGIYTMDLGRGYHIYRKVNNGVFELVYSNGSWFNTSFIDNNIELNNTYYYYVVAYHFDKVSLPTHCNGGEGLTVTERPAYAQKLEVNPTGLNRARVRWVFDNKENSGTISIYRRKEGDDFTTPFFTGTLPVTGDECIDNNVPAGARLEYKIERTVNGNTSAPVYDLLYMPYRDVTKPTSVYIKKLKFSNVQEIESWRGAPEYLIKGYRVKGYGATTQATVAFGTRIDCKKSHNDWHEVNRLLMSHWQPGFDGADWYDVISLHIVELDATDNSELANNVIYSAKALKKGYENITSGENQTPNSVMQRMPWAKIILTAIEVGLDLASQWIKSPDDQIGYVYLNYFDDPHSEFSIPALYSNGIFSIQFSDKP